MSYIVVHSVEITCTARLPVAASRDVRQLPVRLIVAGSRAVSLLPVGLLVSCQLTGSGAATRLPVGLASAPLPQTQ